MVITVAESPAPSSTADPSGATSTVDAGVDGNGYAVDGVRAERLHATGAAPGRASSRVSPSTSTPPPLSPAVPVDWPNAVPTSVPDATSHTRIAPVDSAP